MSPHFAKTKGYSMTAKPSLREEVAQIITNHVTGEHYEVTPTFAADQILSIVIKELEGRLLEKVEKL